MTDSRQDDPEAVEELGQRYELLHQIREEPWGEVWLATDRLLHTEVALKLFPRTAPDWAAGQKIMVQEAVLSLTLRHPRILGIFFLGEAEDGLYLVEEPFDGESLMARLSRKQRFLVPEALRLLEQAGQALAFAHQQGVAHQSFNPLHILLKGEEVRVANFACPPGEEEEAVHLELKAYIPPEVLHGEDASPPGNVFSLGVLGYRLLAGSLPYPLTFDEPFPYRLETMPIDLEEIPLPLQNLLLQCLAPQPEDRLADAGAFLTQLRQLQEMWQTGGETWVPEEPGESKASWRRMGPGAAGIPGKIWSRGKSWAEGLYAGLQARFPSLAQVSSRRFWWGFGLAGTLLILILIFIGVQVISPPTRLSEPPAVSGEAPGPSPGVGPPLTEQEEPGIPPGPAPAAKPAPGATAALAPPPAPPREKPAPLKEEKYLVIAGAFPQPDQARALARRLKGKNFQVQMVKISVKGKPVYQVRLGPFPGKKAAEETAQRLKTQEQLSPRVAKLKPKPAAAPASPRATR